MEPTEENARARTWARRTAVRTVAQTRKTYQGLKSRYGPRYARAMLGAAFVSLFLPVPGSWLICIGSVALIAEVHRAVNKTCGWPETVAALVVVTKAKAPGWATGRWYFPRH